MKKSRKTLFSLALALLLLSCPICSAKEELTEDMLGIDYNAYVAEPLSPDISFHPDDSAAQKAQKAVETLSIGAVFSYFLNSLRALFLPSLRTFSGIFAMILLSALFGAIKENLGGAGDALESLSALCLAWYLFAVIKPMFHNISVVVERLSLFMVSLIPTLAALTGAGGGQAQAGISTATTTLILNYVQSVCVYVMFPAAKAALVLCVITAVSDMVNLSGVTSFIKNLCVWGMGVLMTIFSGILFFQSSIAAYADSLSIRGARFVASSFVPVVGSMVGESMRTVAASVMLIKSVTGMLGISAMIYFVIPPLCAVLINKAYLLLCAFTSKIIGLPKQAAFLYEVNSVLNILNALVISVSLTFIVIVSVFINAVYSA